MIFEHYFITKSNFYKFLTALKAPKKEKKS